MRIAIAGNIGSGKTTLTQLLSKHYGWEAYYEDADENPYIYSFYEDMQRWSFHLQIYFLNSRLKKIMEFQKTGKTVIHDRTIYEDAEIFAPNLQEMGLITTRDFETYKDLYNSIRSLVKPPDLMIYLKASVPTLVKLIQKRGRDYESSIRLDYLSNLNERYEEWIDKYDSSKLLTIQVDKVNFADNQEEFGFVINQVEAEINSLFDQEQEELFG
ncbi:MAG: deoxynucleoside kinase [Bacteroidetes bacterium]|nr:MAG: deoxynucleoside kinase [Bacteroidota bacterium]